MRTLLILFGATTLTISAAPAVPADAAPAKPSYALRTGRKPGRTDRVEVLLEVGGEVTQVVQGGKAHREKMSVVGQLRYDEKTLEVPNGNKNWTRSVRYYENATAVVKVGEAGLKPVLRPERRLIGAEFDGQTVTLFAPHGPLTRDELELIDVLGSSILLDRFLPRTSVEVGQAWTHSEKLMAAFLGLDEVVSSEVRSVLSDVTDMSARIQMSGRVEGAIHGISTEIEVKAKYRFDRNSRRIDWFGLLLKEQRNSSPVTDGVDVVARVQIKISPKAGPGRLDDAGPLGDAGLKDVPLRSTAEGNQLHYQSSAGGWRLKHDRCWYVVGDHQELAVLRMIDRGEYVAQCKVSPLPKVAPGKQVALAEFQDDVRKALGKSFGKFVEAGQWGNEANYQVCRVVARGEVSELPIQWNYYLVADQHGHQVAFAFSVESELVERLGKADRKLVRSLRFLDPKVAGTKQEKAADFPVGKRRLSSQTSR